MKRARIYQRLIFLICLLPAASFALAQTAWFAEGCPGEIYWRYSMCQARLMIEKRSDHSGESIICRFGYRIDKNLKHAPRATIQTYSWGMDYQVPGSTPLQYTLLLQKGIWEAIRC